MSVVPWLSNVSALYGLAEAVPGCIAQRDVTVALTARINDVNLRRVMFPFLVIIECPQICLIGQHGKL